MRLSGISSKTRGLAKRLGDQQYLRYAIGAPAYTLRARSAVNVGDPLPFWINDEPPRAGRRQALKAEYTAQFQVDGFDVEMPYAVSDDRVLSVTHYGSATGAEVRVEEVRGSASARSARVGGGPDGQAVAEQCSAGHAAAGVDETKAHGKVRRRAGRAVDGDAREGRVVAAANGGRCERERRRVRAVRKGFARFRRGKTKDIPAGMGCLVYVVTSDGKRHPAGDFSAGARGANSTSKTVMRAIVPNLTDAAVDFVFVPDPQAAKRTVDTFEIWGGEIVKRGVTVKYATPRPARRAATMRAS
jgi:hypothetical protein